MTDLERTAFHIYILYQGRIQDFKLGGGAVKKIAPSGGRREHFWGISCEKSRFYAKKIIFFPILGEGRAPGAPTPVYVFMECGRGSRYIIILLINILRKPSNRKSLSNFITCCIEYTSPARHSNSQLQW
jgi:hypothetical protein